MLLLKARSLYARRAWSAFIRSIMAETKNEAESTPSLKRSRDDCCSNDDSPEPQQNLKGDTSSVAVTKSRENNQ